MRKISGNIKLNLGCGGRPLTGYINIDSDDLATLKQRYPKTKFPRGIKIYNYNIFDLPFKDESVSVIKADSLIEHLSFIEEPKFFYEVKRVLRPEGIFEFSTTNFEVIVKEWLLAKDEWQDFFRKDKQAITQNHWFGTYSYKNDNRWGYLCASIFGSQNGHGQFHKNCYTVKKIKAILKRLGFKEEKISLFKWKKNRDSMIYIKARKLLNKKWKILI